MFEKALRMKLRFTFRGQCSVEDLWDLSVGELDGIFKGLNSELQDTKGESLLETKTKSDEILELKVAIIRHIVGIKLEERRELEDKVLRAEKKQKLLSIIAEKQDEQYKGMSIKALTKLIDGL